MNNLDLLKQEFLNVKNEGILKYLIPVLEDFDKQINDNWCRIQYYDDTLKLLNEKIKKLEQEGSYYPRTEKEIKNIKVGGTD